MNEDDFMILDKFIKSSACPQCGSMVGSILLSGPSCIGKTHFSSYLKKHGFSKTIGKLNFRHFLNGTEHVPDRKGVILIGAPYKIYLERWKERGLKDQHKAKKFAKELLNLGQGRDAFKEKYIKCIKKYEEYNIPHILIDNRNDCLILDKSSFIAMLTEK